MKFNLLNWSKVSKGDYDARHHNEMPVCWVLTLRKICICRYRSHLPTDSCIYRFMRSVAHTAVSPPHMSLQHDCTRPPLLPRHPVSGSDWPISACSERNLSHSHGALCCLLSQRWRAQTHSRHTLSPCCRCRAAPSVIQHFDCCCSPGGGANPPLLEWWIKQDTHSLPLTLEKLAFFLPALLLLAQAEQPFSCRHDNGGREGGGKRSSRLGPPQKQACDLSPQLLEGWRAPQWFRARAFVEQRRLWWKSYSWEGVHPVVLLFRNKQAILHFWILFRLGGIVFWLMSHCGLFTTWCV